MGNRNQITFTCTEHFGKEDINLLILEPLVRYINSRLGKEAVYIREEYKDEVLQLIRRINVSPGETVDKSHVEILD